MRTAAEIKTRIAEIESDFRLKQPDAHIHVNGYLAIAQIELKSELQALEWTLKSDDA